MIVIYSIVNRNIKSNSSINNFLTYRTKCCNIQSFIAQIIKKIICENIREHVCRIIHQMSKICKCSYISTFRIIYYGYSQVTQPYSLTYYTIELFVNVFIKSYKLCTKFIFSTNVLSTVVISS